MKPKKLLFEFIVLAAVLLALALPRLPALGRFVTADEPTWGKRSASFYYALSEKDYASTFQSPHPGVTAMWAGAAAYHLRFPEYKRVGQEPIGDTKLFQLFQRHGPTPMEVLAQARLFVALANVAALLLAFYFIRRSFGTLATLIGFGLIAFDPFLVAHARLLHIDALLSSFMFCSLAALLVYLRERSWPALVTSGLAAGLSLLTKTPAVILIPVAGLLALLELGEREAPGRFRSLSKKLLLPLALWGMLALAALVALWPAMWVDPAGTLTKTVGYSLSSAEGELGGAQFVDAFNEEGGDDSKYLYFYPLSYLWRSTPAGLLGLLLAGGMFLSRKKPFETAEKRKAAFGLLLFSLVFLLSMSLGDKKFDRYLLPAYLPLDLLAGLGWASVVYWLLSRSTALKHRLAANALIGVVVGIQAAVTLFHFPYYLTYYNPLLGGIQKAERVMMVGWGEGLNQAALYLREKPEIEQKRVLSWYPLAFNWYSSSFKFVSESIPFTSGPEEPVQNAYLASDYVVVYINQWQRRIPGALFDLLEDREPEGTIWIDGIEYVRIYRLNP